MTRFESPVFHHSSDGLPPALVRGLLGAASVALTAVLWVAVGTQAGQFGEEDGVQRVTLEPVVVAGRRLAPENLTAALGAGPAAVDCAQGAFAVPGAGKRVNLDQ